MRLSDRANSLQESAIRKLDHAVWKATEAGVDFYKVNIGQPDVPTPLPLLNAVAAFQPKVISYGPASGTAVCRVAAARYHERWSPGLMAEHIAVTVGGSEALLFAFTAICDPGDEIVVFEPYYTNYNGFATVAGATIRPVRTRIEDGFKIPSDEALDAVVSDRTRAVVFSNPGNPTGAVYGREELERLLRWAKRHDLFVISDEVYRRIWFDERPTSALEFEDYRDRVVVVDSLSKTYSACGVRIGFFISRNEQLMEKVERIGQARLGAQPLAQDVAVRALQLPKSYYDDIRGIYKERVEVMMEALSGLDGVVAPTPKGAFYTMARLPVDNTEAFAKFLVTEFRDRGESVVVAPGPGFYGTEGAGLDEIRLAGVSEPDRLRRAVELIGLGLRAYNASGA